MIMIQSKVEERRRRIEGALELKMGERAEIPELV